MDTQKPACGSGLLSGSPTEVPEPDQSAPADAGTGPENTDASDDGQGSTSPKLVDRKTGLRYRSIGSGRIGQSTIRKRTERDIRLPDAEIPYFKTEKVFRDLICSLMERQTG